MAAKGMQFPWQWASGTISTNLDVIWGMSVKMGAKVVRHGRYLTFLLAEVAIPRDLFAEILRQIDGLRPAPLPP